MKNARLHAWSAAALAAAALTAPAAQAQWSYTVLTPPNAWMSYGSDIHGGQMVGRAFFDDDKGSGMWSGPPTF